jgi:hypothetical protein
MAQRPWPLGRGLAAGDRPASVPKTNVGAPPRTHLGRRIPLVSIRATLGVISSRPIGCLLRSR